MKVEGHDNKKGERRMKNKKRKAPAKKSEKSDPIKAKVAEFITDATQTNDLNTAEQLLGQKYAAFFESPRVKQWFIQNKDDPIVMEFINAYTALLQRLVENELGPLGALFTGM
jgi:hypothetical protein